MNTIEIEKEKFEEEKLNKMISSLVKILLDTGYEIKIFKDEFVICIEFDFDNSLGFGNENLHWVSEDEWLRVLDDREENKKEEEKNDL